MHTTKQPCALIYAWNFSDNSRIWQSQLNHLSSTQQQDGWWWLFFSAIRNCNHKQRPLGYTTAVIWTFAMRTRNAFYWCLGHHHHKASHRTSVFWPRERVCEGRGHYNLQWCVTSSPLPDNGDTFIQCRTLHNANMFEMSKPSGAQISGKMCLRPPQVAT